jgi:hypothetical protein
VSSAKIFGILLLVTVLAVTLFAGITPSIQADSHNDEGSFYISVLIDGEWQLQGKLSFFDYETLQIPLNNNTGQLKLRLMQKGHDSAYVDYLSVQKSGMYYSPVSAINIDDNSDVLIKILNRDYDVCNGWSSTLEIVWDSVPENATLVMCATEEDLGEGHGAPMYYPWPYEHRTLSYLLVNDGSINVDGLLDECTEPDFSVFWQPYTPHPDGYTYGWIHCDNKYLYAAVEVTGDNTADEGDWGAFYIIVDGKQKEFRVSSDQTWGARGFQYTSSVPYEHRIYEFKIPLSKINAVVGDEIHYVFGAYGTMASCALTFDTVPANTGSIVFDGLTYHDGNCSPLGGVGPYNITANPAPGYAFVEWQVEGSIAVDNPYSGTTQLLIKDRWAPSVLRMVQQVQDAGSYLFTDSSSNTPEVTISTPTSLSVKYLNVQPQQARINQTVTVFANIINNGDQAGSYKAILKINGYNEQIKEGNIGSHAVIPIKFELFKEEPGIYNVDVNGQKTYFIVADENGSVLTSKTIPMIIITICTIAIIIITALLLLRKRTD